MFNGKILVVVDMQNDFISGTLGSGAALQTVMPVREKIAQAQKEGTAIFVTIDSHDDNYLETLEGQKLPVEHCIIGTEGRNLHPVIHGVLESSKFFSVTKKTFGALDLPDAIIMNTYISDIKDIKEIEVCGLCTDICVINNLAILRAAFPNTVIKVDSKACAGTSIEAHKAALLVMKSLQIDMI